MRIEGITEKFLQPSRRFVVQLFASSVANEYFSSKDIYGGSITFYHFLAATREIAFIQALSAAAITHEITHQCTQNKIPGCGCPPWHIDPEISDVQWVECGDYIVFGEKKSRPFTDRLKKRPDAQAVVHLHNNAVGREVTSFFYRVCDLIMMRVFVCTASV